MAEFYDEAVIFVDPAVEQSETVKLEGVTAIFIDRDGMILLDHIKFGVLTIPVGKPEEGETPEEAIAREMREELGVEINRMRKIERVLYYSRYDGDEKPELQANTVFLVDEFSGTPESIEKHKHRGELIKMQLSELIKLKPEDTTTATLRAIKYLIDSSEA